ncbi:exo-alpha-sialidase [Flavobacterium pectinovorum]|uniref:exo-alpha-sialidase n=1 Tax=Flavobacterium pectinovorum TaxID=29533 RepID=UPI001FABFF98|nr:exo-alpha-sialidase [Flavobacterium pectinovorum]MCI9843578.1 exo-alpha-sialidase [Flavobacterium pectinovorum]
MALNNVRTFEVTACKPSKNTIIAAWMEKRPNRTDNDESAANTSVAYKFSNDNGNHWNEKALIDIPDTFGTGNPYLTTTADGKAYLAVMHIGNNFYEGNISVYEFNFDKKIFELKSVPFKSDSMLLDKPAIAAFGNEIHLVYTAYPKANKNSLKYQMSLDKGKSWSEPVTIQIGDNVSHLGASIALLKNNQVIISCGTYSGNDNIYLIKKKVSLDSIAFEKPVIIKKGPDNRNAVMSELSSSNDHLVVSCQSPHQPDKVFISYSTDQGNHWSDTSSITQKGNLLSAHFDQQGDMHILYSDFNDNQFSVLYKSFDQNNSVVNQKTICEPADFKQQEYIGAFQKLLIQDSQYYCFWIDYTNNSELRFTKWKN